MTVTARVATVLLVLIAVTMGGVFAIEAVYRDRASELEARHRLHLVARESAWNTETDERMQADQREDQDRLVRQHEEMIQAFGGPVAAAAKNPQVNIAGMLGDVCRECTGVNGATRLTVERFTEFHLAIESERLGTDRNLDEIILCVLKHCAFYVHQIQILRQGLVVAALDRRAIELTPDWSHATVETVRAGLEEMENDGRVGKDDPALRWAALEDEEGNLTVRASRWKKALAKLDEAANRSIQSINRAVQFQRQALLAQRVGSSGAFSAAGSQLSESQRMLKEARAFFSAPADHYRRMLTEAGVDRLYIDAELRSFQTDGDPIRAILALELIENAERRGDLTRRLLQILAEDQGNWIFHAASGQISFESERTAETFRTLSSEIEKQSANLESAMTRWNGSVRK